MAREIRSRTDGNGKTSRSLPTWNGSIMAPGRKRTPLQQQLQNETLRRPRSNSRTLFTSPLLTIDDILPLSFVRELQTFRLKIRYLRQFPPFNDLSPLNFRILSHLYHI